MTLKEIVADWLKEHGYDGLCQVGNDDFDGCGCGLDGLFPCGEPEWDDNANWPCCEAAYKYKKGGFGPNKKYA